MAAHLPYELEEAKFKGTDLDIWKLDPPFAVEHENWAQELKEIKPIRGQVNERAKYLNHFDKLFSHFDENSLSERYVFLLVVHPEVRFKHPRLLGLYRLYAFTSTELS